MNDTATDNLSEGDIGFSSNSSIGATLALSDLEKNLHPALYRLREAEPVSWVPAINAWLVTRRDLTIEVMRDAKTYTVDHPGFSTGQVVGPSMLSLDGENHQRHRMPFERPFRLKEVQSRFDKPVAAHIGDLLDGFVGAGKAELRRAYAGPIAVKTMVTALGLNETPVEEVLGWYDTIVDAVTRVSAGEPVSVEGRVAYASLSEHLLPSLKQDPESNLLAAASYMINGSADSLSDEQIISNAAVLLFGGIETTEGMIANAFYFLLTNPEWIERLEADPQLVAGVVEESLRLEPAAAVVDRYATRDVTIGGAHIKAGDLVQVSLAGANRDPETFPNPDLFDPLRPNLRSHVTFAQGPHVCLGIHLARLEAQLAINQAVATLPKVRLRQSKAVQQSAQPRGLIFRKPEALHVLWG